MSDTLASLEQKIAQLEALRPALGDVAVDAAIAALRAQAIEPPSTIQHQAGNTMHAQQSQGFINHPFGPVEQKFIYEAPPNSEEERQRRALITYLESTATTCNALSLGSLDATDAAHRRPMELSRVYIGLNTTMRATALEALAHTEQHRLMLLGAPGSGKSTFVNHLAACLTSVVLPALREDVKPDATALAKTLPGWSLGALLPIRIILRDFAAFEPLTKAKKGSVQLLLDFLHATLQESGCGDALESLIQRLAGGDALLLLDGLDEVVGKTVLARVAETITAAAGTYTHSPILVTCRILDYQAEPLRQLRGFPTQTLADFTDEQVNQFVNHWYGELAASGRRSPAQAREDIQALQQAIAAREELRNLARLPLLATVMALVHTNQGTLPDARALLYYECIEILLLRWRQQRGEGDLLTRLGLSQFRSDNLLALMARLGFVAHEQAERDAGDEMARPADLEEQQVLGLLAEGFAQYDAERKHALAEIVLNALARGNGLLLKRGPGVYAFPHRTFQEFLAGYYLLRQSNYETHCLERAGKPHWHEALTLMVGYQVLAAGEFDKPLSLVEKLLTRSPSEQVLAGDLLVVMGQRRLASERPAVTGKDGLWRRTHTALLKLATQGSFPYAPAPLRVRAGLVMGRLCTYDAPDATVPVLDPRLPLAVIGLSVQQSTGWRKALMHYWCNIEVDDFWYGDDSKDEELQQVNLPYSFKIARYPVTNADFACFVAAGGYDHEQWWTSAGWEWCQNRQQFAPDDLARESRHNNPVQPVVIVTWYEAAAYCRWLTEQGHTHGWLPKNAEIWLPTSLEWERAARHTDKRPYPWGNGKPKPEHANYDETGIGTTSPVGCFPRGAAVCGALDMAGNALEWLATPYGQRLQIKPVYDLTISNLVFLTWSSYLTYEEAHFRCGSRNWGYPYSRNTREGFRLVWVPHRVGDDG